VMDIVKRFEVFVTSYADARSIRYALMNLGNIADELKIFKVVEKRGNECKCLWSYLGNLLKRSKEVIEITLNIDVIDNEVIVKGLSQSFNFETIFTIGEKLGETVIRIVSTCEGKEKTCSKFLSNFIPVIANYLRNLSPEYLKNIKIKTEVEKEITSKSPGSLKEKDYMYKVAEISTDREVGSLGIQTKSMAKTFESKPTRESEKIDIDLKNILDPSVIAFTLLKSDLISYRDYNAGWRIEDIEEYLKQIVTGIKDREYALVTIESHPDLYIALVVDSNGKIIAWNDIALGRDGEDIIHDNEEELIQKLSKYVNNKISIRIYLLGKPLP